MSLPALRPVCPEDEPLLLELYASTRWAELAQVPWTDEQKERFVRTQAHAQSEHYSARHPQSRHQLVLQDGTPVGRLWTDRQSGRIHMLDLTILPRYRGAGIGTAVIRMLQSEAAESRMALTIYVESFSPMVAYFQRLGFRAAGEEGIHLLLAWKREGES